MKNVYLHVGQTDEEAVAEIKTSLEPSHFPFYLYLRWTSESDPDPGQNDFEVVWEYSLNDEPWQDLPSPPSGDADPSDRDDLYEVTEDKFGKYRYRARVKRKDVGDVFHYSNICTVWVVEVTGLDTDPPGKNAACKDETVTFKVTANPPDHYGGIVWKVDGVTQEPIGGKTLDKSWNSLGTKTVTATCCGSSASKEIEIIEALTVVPKKAYVPVGGTKKFEAWKCEGGSAVKKTSAHGVVWSAKPGRGSFTEDTYHAPATPSTSIGDDYVRAVYDGTSTEDTGGDCELTVVSVDITDDDDNPITATQTVCVGQKISLKTKIQPSALTASNWQWTIPGIVIKDYEKVTIAPDRTRAFVTELLSTDLQQSSVQFYWIDGADGRNISVSCQINEEVNCADTVQYNVKRPTLDSFTSTTGPVVVGNAWGSTQLSCGIPTNPGINFTAKVTPPADFDGQLKFVNLVSIDHTRTYVNDSTEKEEIFGDMWLDGVDPYGNIYNATGGVQKTIVDNDSPALGLVPGFKKIRVFADLYDTFVMFKPTGTDPIWVPIGKLQWGWSGTAQSSDGGNTWIKTDGGHAENNPSGTMTTEFVEWPDTATPTHPGWV